MLITMGHTAELISTIKTLVTILWVHTIMTRNAISMSDNEKWWLHNNTKTKQPKTNLTKHTKKQKQGDLFPKQLWMVLATVIMAVTVGHIIELIFILRTLEVILWVHAIDRPTVIKFKGPCCWLQCFYWIENGVLLKRFQSRDIQFKSKEFDVKLHSLDC